MITRMRPFARELLAQIEPDDVTARMLAVQMIATFSRSLFLSRHANRQKNQRWFELYSIECDRAMTLFRRQVQTLSDLRRPRRTSFTAIRNANIAGQQVVITSPPDPTDLVQDEQPLQKETPALPSQRKRPGRPPLKRPQEPPLET